MDIPIKEALLLWNPPCLGEPAFAVRPLGHRDYDKYARQNGACFEWWRQQDDLILLRLKLMVELWHISAIDKVPAELMLPELLKIPEYRHCLAFDALPEQYHAEWCDRHGETESE